MSWFANRPIAVKLVAAIAASTVCAAFCGLQRSGTGPWSYGGLYLPLIAASVAVFCVWSLHHVIGRPIAQLARAMGKLADGDTSVVIPNTAWGEEIGAMSRALEILRKDMIDAKRMRADEQGVRLRSKRDRAALRASTADSFETVVGSIVRAVSSSTAEMHFSAGSLFELAQRATEQVGAVAGSTKTAAANMQSVARGTEQLLESVSEINAQMAHSSDIAHRAVAEADRTTQTIDSLSQSANRIGVIVGLINDIARQTNLLALNATIEAARAGDAGRGFSVVAAEVKTLAAETARATDDIRRQIEAMQSAASVSVAAIKQISSTIDGMAHVTFNINAAVEHQGEATREMVRGTQEAARATAAVSLQLDQVSQGAVTTATAATQLLSAAKELAQTSTVLHSEAGRFATSVRTG